MSIRKIQLQFDLKKKFPKETFVNGLATIIGTVNADKLIKGFEIHILDNGKIKHKFDFKLK